MLCSRVSRISCNTRRRKIGFRAVQARDEGGGLNAILTAANSGHELEESQLEARKDRLIRRQFCARTKLPFEGKPPLGRKPLLLREEGRLYRLFGGFIICFRMRNSR